MVLIERDQQNGSLKNRLKIAEAEISKLRAQLVQRDAELKRINSNTQQIIQQANDDHAYVSKIRKSLDQERAYSQSLRQEIEALKQERERQWTIEAVKLVKAKERISQLEDALVQVQKSIVQTGKIIEGEVSDVEIESVDSESKEELIRRFEDYTTAEWDEKPKTEIELHTAVCLWLIDKWSADSDWLQNAVLEISTNQKRYVAVSLFEKPGVEKPYIVYCLVLRKEENGIDYTLIRKRQEYVRKGTAHNKAAEWLNGFFD